MNAENAERRPCEKAACPANNDSVKDHITAAEILRAIERGARQGVRDAFAEVDIGEALATGVWQAMPYGESICLAIENGVAESLKRPR